MGLKTIFLLISFIILALVLATCQNIGPTTTESAPDAMPTEAPAEEETAEETEDAETNESEVTSSEDEQSEESASEETAPEESGSEAAVDVGEPTIFQIVQEQTEARFHIDEVLRGEDVTVVGKTSMVTGRRNHNQSRKSGANRDWPDSG